MKGQKKSSLAGQFSEEHFMLLLGGTSIRAKGVVGALRDYLVNGFSKAEAVRRNETSFPQFSVRLGKVVKVHQHQLKLSKFYQIEESGEK